MTSNSKTNSRKSTSNEIVFRAVQTIVKANTTWTGTMTELQNSILKLKLNQEEKTLIPKSPSSLRLVLNNVINRLRNQGIGVRFGRTTDSMRTRFVKFVK